MKITARVIFSDHTSEADRQLRKGLSEVLRTSAIQVQEEARKRAPKNSGKLRESIKARFAGQFTGGGERVEALTAEVVPGVDYAPAVEAKTPFMQPAAEAVQDDFFKAVADVVRRLGVK